MSSIHSKPLLEAAHLWAKKRPDGATYLTGRAGGLRFVVRPIANPIEGGPRYTLLIGEAERAGEAL